MAEPSYKYWAFISYSHQDRAWANWLHKALETYRVPRRLVGREHWSGTIPRRLHPVFRDRDELPSSAELGTVLNEALRQSRYLIVICSPQAVASRWVNEEVKYFKSLGRSHRVLPLVIGGEPDASSKPGSGLAECLPSAVRYEVDANGEISTRRSEPIAADARGGKDGRANAKLKLIAGLIGVGLDELKQRERQRQRWQRISVAAAAIALALLAGFGWSWQQAEKQRALDAQALKTRIAQLYENGRQELLAHNEARAAVYLNEAYKLGVDTPALRFMLARAMRVVDAEILRVNVGSAVYDAALSPDGKRFLTVDQNWHLSVWNAQTGARLFENDLGSDTQTTLAEFSPKGSLVWVLTSHSGAPANRLDVFDAESGKLRAQYVPSVNSTGGFPSPIDEADHRLAILRPDFSIDIASLDGHTSKHIPGRYTVTAFCKDRDSLIAGTDTGSVLIFDSASLRSRKKFSGLRGVVVALASSDGCRTIAAGTTRGEVRVWDVSTGAVLMSGGHAQSIADLRLNPSGTRLMSYTRGGMSIWNGQTGALLHSEKFYDEDNALGAVNPAGTLLASMRNSRLVLIDPVSELELFTLDAHQGSAQSFNFGAGGRKFVSAGVDGSAVIWNLPETSRAELNIGTVSENEGSAQGAVPGIRVALNHRQDQFFTSDSRDGGFLWDRNTLHSTLHVTCDDGLISAMAFSPDDKMLAAGSRNQSICLWQLPDGKLLHRMSHAGSGIFPLLFDSGGRYLSAGVDGQGTRILDATDGEQLASFEADGPYAQVFSPTGSIYVFASRGQLRMWNALKRTFIGELRLPFKGNEAAKISVVDFSPDGTKLLVAAQKEAAIVNAADGRILQQVTIPAAAGFYVGRFSPDGRRVALGDQGKTVFIWGLGDNQVLGLSGHTAAVRAVGFTPDSALAVSAGGDGLIKIWDAETGQELDSQKAHDGAVSWGGLQLTSTDETLLTGGTDGIARLWPMPQEHRNPEEISLALRCRIAWQIVGVKLTPQQPLTRGCGESTKG